MLSCILIDDEPLALELLQDYVEKTDGIQVLGSFTNPIKALEQLEELSPDIIFTDVQMPELNGVQLSKIHQSRYHIVLTTAYTEYAVQGYELDIADYLLKPITLERFQKTVSKVEKLNRSSAEHIFVKSEYKTHRVDLSAIVFIKGMADYVTIHTATHKLHTLGNLKDYATSLPADNFIRVHRSYIVAIDKIDFIERNRIVANQVYIPIGEKYRASFFKHIEN